MEKNNDKELVIIEYNQIIEKILKKPKPLNPKSFTIGGKPILNK